MQMNNVSGEANKIGEGTETYHAPRLVRLGPVQSLVLGTKSGTEAGTSPGTAS
jgi:hypothetical protein